VGVKIGRRAGFSGQMLCHIFTGQPENLYVFLAGLNVHDTNEEML
jgi:hypothetical protein